MARYLKSLSMKALDGSAVKLPFCCINCNKDRCKIPCKEYVEEMKEQKCSRCEMEFGVYEGWGELWAKDIIRIILAVGLMFMGCDLAKSMKATSLLQLKENAQEVGETFEKCKKNIDAIETELNEYSDTIKGMTSHVGEFRRLISDLRAQLEWLQKDVGEKRNSKTQTPTDVEQ